LETIRNTINTLKKDNSGTEEKTKSSDKEAKAGNEVKETAGKTDKQVKDKQVTTKVEQKIKPAEEISKVKVQDIIVEAEENARSVDDLLTDVNYAEELIKLQDLNSSVDILTQINSEVGNVARKLRKEKTAKDKESASAEQVKPVDEPNKETSVNKPVEQTQTKDVSKLPETAPVAETGM